MKHYNQIQSFFIQAVKFQVIMLKLIIKNYSEYHVLKESQTLCSGTKSEILSHGCQVWVRISWRPGYIEK